ncbi:MAG: hypothetical protein V4689_08760 [Verrucomicrobiota bacterium]
MKINVSTLLREFPKVRQAALAGEEVIIVTREGNLRLTAVDKTGASILGCMKGMFTTTDEIDGPTTSEADWKPSL